MAIVLTDGKETAVDYIARIKELGGEVSAKVECQVFDKENAKAEEAALSL